ncbi:MAG: isoprenylcysteine carboxylmethyltransferase family protein [Solirubrobacteraceae bacterium]
MKPLPFTDFGAEIAFYVVLVPFAALELAVRLRTLVNREGSREDRASFALLYVTVATGIVGPLVIAANVRGAAIAFARWPIFVLGVALMASGVVIRAWAVVLLGRFFTNDVRVHPGQTVVDTGPYRWVRHPSYSGLILILIGLGLALGNWAALAIAVVLPTAALVNRIRVEERALLDGLGEPYRRFAAGRARLLPGVW